MTNEDLKFNGRQDAYVDVRFDGATSEDYFRTVVVETNHGTYALCFMDVPRGRDGDERYGDVDIALYDGDAMKDITASGWADGRGADLKFSDHKPGPKIHERAATKLIAILSGTIKKREKVS